MQYGPGLNSVLQHELFIMEDRPTIRAIALEGGKSVCRLGGGGAQLSQQEMIQQINVFLSQIATQRRTHTQKHTRQWLHMPRPA